MPRTFDAPVYSSETDKDVIARAVRAGRLVRLASGIYTSQLDREPADVVRTHLWSIVGHALPGGLFMSGEARSLLDNLTRGRTTATGSSRKLSRAQVEAWIDSLCAQRGEQGLNRLRDQARGLALARLAEHLASHAPEAIPALPEDAGRRTLLPFYEAYFSNYIEGTEFTLDEGAEIVFGHTIPQSRPADAHDIMGTYAVTSSDALMSERPESAARLIEMLRERHGIVLGGRPSAWPGAGCGRTAPDRRTSSRPIWSRARSRVDSTRPVGCRVRLPAPCS